MRLKVLFDSLLTRKEVKPTPIEMLSIVVMATYPSLKIHTLWRNILAPTDVYHYCGLINRTHSIL